MGLGRNRRVLTVTLSAIAALTVCACVSLLVLAHLRGPVTAFFAWWSGRPLRVEGSFDVQLLRRHPRVLAERVIVSNPPWSGRGTMAEIGAVTLELDVPLLAPAAAIHRLELRSATLHLVRDAQGDSNWQWSAPGRPPGHGPPLVHGLSAPDVRMFLNDERQHLKFDGEVDVHESQGPGAASAGAGGQLLILGTGQLNGASARINLTGDPLAQVRRSLPYRFQFSAQSSGTRMSGRGELPTPFDWQRLDTRFEAQGDDLRDLYYLIGLTLPDTGAYTLKGKAQRHGQRWTFSDLSAGFGASDVHGSVSSEILDGQSHLEIELDSRLLRLSDLGPTAAGRGVAPDKRHRLLPDNPFHLQSLRRTAGPVHFRAALLELGRMSFHKLQAGGTMANGVLDFHALTATLAGGALKGRARLDANGPVPDVHVDLTAQDVELERLATQPLNAPLQGRLQARIRLHGRGASLHEMAAHSEGTATAVLPQGSVREALAKAVGADFRALGLMSSGSADRTTVRCGIANFQVNDGVVHLQEFLLDTDRTKISGSGTLQLASEEVDLRIEGHPKKPTLRLHAPLLIQGELRHPTISVSAGRPAAQAGAAIALSALATPLAGLLAFVDPGLARNADCSAVVEEAAGRGAPVSTGAH